MINVDLKPLLKRLNPFCTRSLEAAAGLCVSRGSYEIAIEHMLLTLISDSDHDFQLILRHYELEPARVEKALQHAVEEGRTGNTGKPVFAPLLIEWVQESWMLASLELGQGDIRSGVLIATMLNNPRRYGYGSFFDELEAIPAEDLRRHLMDITAGSKEVATALGVEKRLGAPGAPGAEARGPDTALGRFTQDLTGAARAGKIDPVFCRDREIRQMIDILGRRRKNNPICVGEAGVGKSAVVEGLALKIVQGDVPENLRNVDIYGLDLQLLQAGAGVKGEFENRLKGVMDEVKSSPKPIVLFIDEVHTLIGAGGSAGTGDAANILKPALARGEMRTIAATTFSEYKKYIDKDAALARRFQLVKLDEPSPDEAVIIIRGLRDIYERAHGVYVRDDAVEAAARMSARYISGRQLPDKAVDVLDTASARVKLSVSAKPNAIDDLERRIQEHERERNAIARDVEAGVRADDGRIAELNEQVEGIRGTLAGLTERWHKEQAAALRVLDLRKRIAAARDASAAGAAGAAAGGGNGDAAEAEAPVEDIDALKQELETAKGELAAIQGKDPLIHYEATPEVVAQVISDWTGIPLGNMVRDEAAAILHFTEQLGRRIKGQGHAIDALDSGIRAAKAGLQNPNAPLGVFLFVGPSGVGKTETGLGLADLLFGGERFMTVINMSEFQEKHTVSRLIGSPPGYVGYGEGGKLTEAVRQRPYSVVLLDEVEKADLEVMNLFYQVFDKGMLSDGEGRLIDFKNTIILLTSNLASEIITEMCSGDEIPPIDTITEAIRPVLSGHFKPALLGRMTVVPFLPVHGEAMKEIVSLKLDRVGDRLRSSRKMNFVYSPEVVDQITQRCTEVETGARNVDHIINKTLLPQISTRILEQLGDEEQLTAIEVGIGESGDFTYTFRTAAG